MPTPPLRARAFPALVLVAAALTAQEGVPRPPGLVPEKVWPAPTAADWAKPCLIGWQRSWEDAWALAQRTHRPILACINMDGEIASEHYAGVRYRQPDIARLYEPYICVIASVYRHNARDYDEHGHRIPCPRFGGVTCGEHIAIEPVLYERYLDGKRVAPRHIMIELDAKKTYDVFFTWDTESVFRAIADGIGKRAMQPLPAGELDGELAHRMASTARRDREALERLFADGDRAQRRALLDLALGLGADAPVEILRLAAYSLDVDLARAARQGMAMAGAPGAVELIADALRVPMAAEERQALVANLRRLGERSPRAKMLATAHEGLAARTTVVDVEAFAKPGGGSYAGADVARDAAAQAIASDAAVAARPADPEARLLQAEATLTQALAPGGGPPGRGSAGPGAMAERFRQLWFEDAENGARAAVQLGASGPRVDAVLALCAFHAGRYREAYERAVPAVTGMTVTGTKERLDGPIAAALLALFAEARQEAIDAAVRQKADWPPQWLTDVDAAYAALARSPFGTDANVADHYDFLDFFGAESSQRVLDEGLRRFPASPRLHERLRARILRLQNPAALEADYAARLQADGALPVLASFAGYAELVVAEAHRRAGAGELALAAYARALQCYDRYVAADATDPSGGDAAGRDTSSHFVAVALAGRARVLLERGDLEPALAAVEASLDRREASAAAQDGLGFTAVDTARMLLAKLREGHRDELAARLDARLLRLDPALLEPPPYERAVGTGRRGRGGRRDW